MGLAGLHCSHLGLIGFAPGCPALRPRGGAVGYPMQVRPPVTAQSLGLDCRVGMEDSL